MQLIEQRGSHDCGVACLAMLAGRPYGDAAEAFAVAGLDRWRRRKPPWSSNSREVCAAASLLGLELRVTRFRGFDQVRTAAIAKVLVRDEGDWHWVVFARVGGALVMFDPGFESPFEWRNPLSPDQLCAYWPHGCLLLPVQDPGPATVG